MLEAGGRGEGRDSGLEWRSRAGRAPRAHLVTHDDIAAMLESISLVGQHEIGAQRREAVGCNRDRRRHEVERQQLCVRVLDGRARSAPLVDEELYVGTTGVDVHSGPVAQDGQYLGGLIVIEVAERRAVLGREHDHLVRAGGASPCVGSTDDRIQVRHRAHAPARSIGWPGAGARDLGRRLALVSGTERTRRRALADWGCLLVRRGLLGGRRGRSIGERAGAATGREQDESPGQRVVTKLRHDAQG